MEARVFFIAAETSADRDRQHFLLVYSFADWVKTPQLSLLGNIIDHQHGLLALLFAPSITINPSGAPAAVANSIPVILGRLQISNVFFSITLRWEYNYRLGCSQGKHFVLAECKRLERLKITIKTSVML